MKTVWTQHIKDPEEKAKFEEGVRHNRWILDHLKSILDKMDKDFERAELSPKMYDLPNWENRQAHSNGYRQCLNSIRNLINLDQEERQA